MTILQDISPSASQLEKFNVLVKSSIEDQLELFLKSFIFALGDEWKNVVKLASEFRKYIRDGAEPSLNDLNVVQASDFLQKYGITRTASQRTSEIKDIDLDHNNRISLVEYFLLHYKVMILVEYYKRTNERVEEDLSAGGIGITGVGFKLLDELFTIPVGLDPEIEKAIEEFTAMKKAEQEKLDALVELSKKGGVKGLAARNEIFQIEAKDPLEMNRLEITLNAAKRRSGKNSSEVALQKKREQEQAIEAQKRKESRERLAARAALWN
jgi:hypothetical protein